jgi:hypothetical protein
MTSSLSCGEGQPGVDFFSQGSDPDVSKSHRVSMILKQ